MDPRPVTEKRKASRIAISGLTIDQCELIEEKSGIPLEEWMTPKGRLRAFRWIYTVATGATAADVGKMTIQDLTDAITDDEEDPRPPDPP